VGRPRQREAPAQEGLEERKSKGKGLRTLLSGGGRTDQQVKMSEALHRVAQEYDIDSVTAIALTHLMSKAANVFPIVGGRKVEHLLDNVQSLSIKLKGDQTEYLESINDFDFGFPSNYIDEVFTGVEVVLVPRG